MEHSYEIYMEYIRNIHKYLWYKIIRNTGAAFGGAPIGRPPHWDPRSVHQFEHPVNRGPGPSWGPVRVGAHMGPYGQVLAGLDLSDFRLLVEFCMFWVQNLFFEEISK